MLAISNELKTRFDRGDPQCCYIYFPNLNLLVTDKEIKQNSFSIDDKCTSGTWFTTGDAVSAECSFTLMNSDGRFDSINFSGQPYVVFIGTKGYSDNYEDNYFSTADQLNELTKNMTSYSSPIRIRYAGSARGLLLSDYNGEAFSFQNGDVVTVQILGIGNRKYKFERIDSDRALMGVFYADTPVKSFGKKEISVSGLDFLGCLDIPFPVSSFNYDRAPVSLNTLFSTLKNYGYYEATGLIVVFENELIFPGEYLTLIKENNFACRQLLAWLAQLDGKIVKATRQGKIAFIAPNTTDPAVCEISPYNRQGFSLLASAAVPVVGGSFVSNNGKTYLIPITEGITDGIAFNYSSNQLFKNLIIAAHRSHTVKNVNTTYKDISFMPFSSYCPALPYIDVLDNVAILFPDYATPITHINYKLNAWSLIECTGSNSFSDNSINHNGTTAQLSQTKNCVELREAVSLYSSGAGVGKETTIGPVENISLYSAFLITVKNSGGSICTLQCARGYTGIANDEPERVTVRGNFIWRTGKTTYEYYLNCTDNKDDTWTVNTLDFYTVTTEGYTVDRECKIIEILAIS